MSKKAHREVILEMASELVCNARQADYGDLKDSFQRIAALWSTYLGHAITPHQVAAMMVLLKISRSTTSPTLDDNWIDAAGYAAIASELVELELNKGEV